MDASLSCMNSLVDFTDIAPTHLPSQAYSSLDEWHSALADMHFVQLTFQRNDGVNDKNDARDKYVARQLFRRLGAEGRLSFGFDSNGDAPDVTSTFRLFSEDLRPSNVLVDEDPRVIGVIDWEFAYAAPSQLSFDPPWWLLLKCPEYWPGGYEPFVDAYKPRLETFLHILEDEEKKIRADSSGSMASLSLSNDWKNPLSQQMRESWETRSWMINYAARNSGHSTLHSGGTWMESRSCQMRTGTIMRDWIFLASGNSKRWKPWLR